MSNLDRTPGLTTCGGLAGVAPRPVLESFTGRTVLLGESTRVRRLLPNLGRRLVGPWCFVDHYGPDDIAGGSGMQVPPHPHLGLQTVSWLYAGAVHHRDSLGNDAIIRPGELGLMTSGAAISHAEYSPVAPPPATPSSAGAPPLPAMLHGLQLWVALPDGARSGPAAWQHETALPVVGESHARATVIMGELAGARSPGAAHSPIVGVDVCLDADADLLLPLEPEFEHAVLVTDGAATVDDAAAEPAAMLYLGCSRRSLHLRAHGGPARLLLIGGAPFEEQIVMWWNFVARSNDEIAQARADWMTGDRFGTVTDAGRRLDAPPMPAGRLKPGGATR